MNPQLKKLSKILGVEAEILRRLDVVMSKKTGKIGVMEGISDENEAAVGIALDKLGIGVGAKPEEARKALRVAAMIQERQLLAYLQGVAGANEFEKAANLSKAIARVGKGFFLKKSYGEGILMKCRPENLLKFLGYSDITELLARHDVAEIFGVLRFMESDEWMHETFDKAYSKFTAADFEEREIQIKVLGPEWQEVAKQFVAKKHHNVSHLKEFGVIFLNPIKEDMRGKFIRDFALLLHYFHEIEFYSKLFLKNAGMSDFAERLKALLRGDVNDIGGLVDGEWLIIQRYLFKENPQDPRLTMPHVNPESLHWLRGERDLVRLGEEKPDLDLELWNNLDWVGRVFDGGDEQVVSFDLEDNAMSEVAAAEGKKAHFNYHHFEALWTKIFMEYAGGESEMERLLLENFDKGVVKF